MPKSCTHVAAAYRWLTHRPGYMLLTAGDDALAAEPAGRFARAWGGLMLLGLAWGAATAAVWAWSGWLFGWYSGMPLMPTAAVLAAVTLWMYRRSLGALSDMLGGARRAHAVTVTLVAVMALCLLGLRGWNEDSLPRDLPQLLRHVYPRASYRALVLMPMWGAWAMLITAQFRRPDDRTEAAVAAFARGCGPLAAAGCMGVLLAITIRQFNYLPWSQLSIPAVAVAAAIAGGLAACRIAGGLTRSALLAVNFLTQLAFLLAYLANIR